MAVWHRWKPDQAPLPRGNEDVAGTGPVLADRPLHWLHRRTRLGPGHRLGQPQRSHPCPPPSTSRTPRRYRVLTAQPDAGRADSLRGRRSGDHVPVGHLSCRRRQTYGGREYVFMRQLGEFGWINGNSDGLGTARKTTGLRETATDSGVGAATQPGCPCDSTRVCICREDTVPAFSASSATHPVAVHRIHGGASREPVRQRRARWVCIELAASSSARSSRRSDEMSGPGETAKRAGAAELIGAPLGTAGSFAPAAPAHRRIRV